MRSPSIPSTPRSPNSAGSSHHRSRSSPEVVGLHCPLGRSMSQSHYIAPVPPTYVTEYESAYQWPDSSYYAQHSTPPPSPGRGLKKKAEEMELAWSELIEAVRGLPAEVAGDKAALLEAVQGRQLHAKVESLLNELQEKKGRFNVSTEAEERCRKFVDAVGRLKGISQDKPRPK